MTSLSSPNPLEKPPLLDDFCRICLLRKVQLRPLATQFSGVMIPEMLYKVTGTLINMQDQLPRVICDRCLVKVDLAYAISEEFRKQEEKLRRFWWKGGVLVDELMAYARTEESWRKTHSEEVIDRLTIGRLDPVPVAFEAGKATGASGSKMGEKTVKVQIPTIKSELDASELCIEILSDDSDGEAVEQSTLQNPQTTGVPSAETQEELLVEQQPEGDNLDADAPPSSAESGSEQDDNDKDSDYVPDGSDNRADKVRPSSVASALKPIEEDDDSESCVSSDGDVPKLEEGSTACPVCEKEYQTWKLLKRHHRRHVLLAKERYKCKKCGHVVATKQELRLHKMIHLNPGKANCFECKYCRLPFRYESRLDAHEKIHELRNDPVAPGYKSDEGRRKKVFGCKYCDKVFVWECRLRRHESTHERRLKQEMNSKAQTKQKNGPLQCEYCQKNFWLKEDLNLHLKSHDEHIANLESRLKKCHKCDRTYPDECSLEKHLKRHEAMESGDYNCNKCDQAFSSNYILKRHIARCAKKPDFRKITPPVTVVREGRSHFKCRDCGKVFDSRSTYFQHAQIHSVPKSESHHQCPDCGRRFGQRANLRLHQQEVHHLFIKAEPDEGVAGRGGQPSEQPGSDLPIIQEVTGSFVKNEAPLEKSQVIQESLSMDESQQREPHVDDVIDQMDTDQQELGSAFVEVDNVTTPLESVPGWENPASASVSDYTNRQFTDAQESLEAAGFSIEILSDDSDDDVIELSEDDELEQDSRPSTSCSESTSTEAAQTKSWTCNLCDVVMPSATNGSITKHMLMHQNILNGKFKCEVCDKKFGFSPDLQQHRRLIHNLQEPTPEDTVECEYCNKQIKRNKHTFHLSCHKNLETRSIVCEVCDKAFGSKHHLKWHQKSKTCQKAHQEQRPSSATRPVLIQNRNTLQTPEQRQQDGRYKCTECNKSYANSQTIYWHMQEHQAVKEGRYKCEICQLACASKRHLEAHMRIHSESAQPSDDPATKQ